MIDRLRSTFVALATIGCMVCNASHLVAQNRVRPDQYRLGTYIGGIPYVFGDRDGCGDAHPAVGIAGAASRQLINHLAVEVDAAALAAINVARCSTDAVMPLPPGTYASNEFATSLAANPMITPDVRLKLTGDRGAKWELEGGVGWAIPPQRTLYTVLAGNLMWGRHRWFLLGGEYREYHVHYNAVETVIASDFSYSSRRTGSGVDIQRSFMVQLGAVFPIRR